MTARLTVETLTALLDKQASPVKRGKAVRAYVGGWFVARDDLPFLAKALSAPPAAPAGLDLSPVNRARCTAPDGFNHSLESWSIAEWTNAVAGEAGEACNLAKKLIRLRDGVAGNNKPEDRDPVDLKRRVAEELADVVIYCDLAMAAAGYDFATTVREVFNRKSHELNSPYILAAARPEGPPSAL